jgi:hypothetical protein
LTPLRKETCGSFGYAAIRARTAGLGELSSIVVDAPEVEIVEKRRREASDATLLDILALLPLRVDSPREVNAASSACGNAAPPSDVPATVPAAEELPLEKRRIMNVPERCRIAGAACKNSSGLQLAGGQQIAGADRERCLLLSSLAHAECSAGMHPPSNTSRPTSSLMPSPGTGESASQFSATQASCCS